MKTRKSEIKKKTEKNDKSEKVKRVGNARIEKVKPAGQEPDVKSKQGVGIIATIIETLKAGWTTKPEIHQILVKKFPDRPADGMKATISIQLGPTRLASKYNLERDGGRYRISG